MEEVKNRNSGIKGGIRTTHFRIVIVAYFTYMSLLSRLVPRLKSWS